MSWNTFWKRWFGGAAPRAADPSPSNDPVPHPSPNPAATAPEPPLPRIPADRSPWGELLDLRPVTQTLIATSTDREMAVNSVSFGGEDGLCFVGQQTGTTVVESSLQYPVDDVVPDGVLYSPRDMDHKWAIFLHQGKLLFVRSWLRKVLATADVSFVPGFMVVGAIRGDLLVGADPAWTVRAVDFLIRTHVIGEVAPTPDYASSEPAERLFALRMLSLFGRLATVAAFEPFVGRAPTRPVRSNSLLHIAVARGDLAVVDRQLGQGALMEVRANDGLPPLQWAQNQAMVQHLVERGARIDGRSTEGATALMMACQTDRDGVVAYLLEHGADPNLQDNRGFTALHRAAETGRLEAAKLLLAHGADRDIAAHGHTAVSLARAAGRAEMISLLEADR